jgi:inorganic phosphate transporter, PiT family
MEAMLGSLGPGTATLLVLALLLALSFEFVNGFHDTANAVATVIYTHSLKPMPAVVWSGTWNFIGVLTSNGAVAFGIIALLPVELIVNVGSGAGFAMVFALLVSAIIWNVGTWYMGLPASSSHTLIGSIVGVGLMNSYLSATTKFGEGINWGKVSDTVLALLVSPVVGFVCAGALLLLFKALIKNPDLYKSPKGDEKPPLWIRGLLILTCTGVSFAHGSNDGQKGMGLIMLILIGIIPSIYALDLGANQNTVSHLVQSSHASVAIIDRMDGAVRGAGLSDKDAQATLSAFLRSGTPDAATIPALAHAIHAIDAQFANAKTMSDVPTDARRAVRSNVYVVSESLGKLLKGDTFTGDDRSTIGAYRADLKSVTTFIPIWVKAAVALALGLGTMIGWKRIVVTVGEKIGKVHLTYAQGAAAELVAMATIEAADVFGLPVSTTHVLSSGIAGTMFANQSGLQKDTIRNILLAWILTLPVCVFLGASLFAAGLFVVLRLFA